MSRELCIRMFTNQGLDLPPGLLIHEPKNELKLWEAVKVFLSYDEIRHCR
ncbi:hypothetical protein ACFL2Q_00580 [Thermodesulfobacteriota bacterium]